MCLGHLDHQRDPVRDVQAGLAPGLLHDPDHVPRQALGGQLRGHLGVQHHDALATGQRRRVLSVRGHQTKLVLTLFERHPGGDRTPVDQRPLAGLDRPDDLLHEATQARTERPRNHGEHLLAVARHVVGEHHLLDVHLVRDEIGERPQHPRGRRGHGEGAQRQPYPQPLGLAQGQRGRAHLADSVHCGDQRRIGGEVRRRTATTSGAPTGPRSARARSPPRSAERAERAPATVSRARCRACRTHPGHRPRTGPGTGARTSS